MSKGNGKANGAGNGHDPEPVPDKRDRTPEPRKPRGSVKGKGTGPGVPKGEPRNFVKKQVDAVKASGETPLDFMLRIMRNARAPWERRMDMAKAAAPYVHARLSSLEVSGEVRKVIAREPMSPDDWEAEFGVEPATGAPTRIN